MDLRTGDKHVHVPGPYVLTWGCALPNLWPTPPLCPTCAPPPPQLVGILRASVPLFKDMSSFKDFKNQVEDLVHKLDAYQKDQFQV